MADDRTCLDCIAQYSHLPVKLCEEHADERRAGEPRVTLKELAKAAEAAQEKAWEAWQKAFDVAQQARILAYELYPLEKVEEPPLTWNPIRDALKKPTTWRQALGDDPA